MGTLWLYSLILTKAPEFKIMKRKTSVCVSQSIVKNHEKGDNDESRRPDDIRPGEQAFDFFFFILQW